MNRFERLISKFSPKEKLQTRRGLYTSRVQDILSCDFTELKQQLMRDDGLTVLQTDGVIRDYRDFLIQSIRLNALGQLNRRTLNPNIHMQRVLELHRKDGEKFSSDCMRLLGFVLILGDPTGAPENSGYHSRRIIQDANQSSILLPNDDSSPEAFGEQSCGSQLGDGLRSSNFGGSTSSDTCD